MSEADPDTDPLEDAGRQVTHPAVEPADLVRARFEADGSADGLGRLAQLALWWAQVRGDAAAPPPGRVAVLGAAAHAPLPDGVRRVDAGAGAQPGVDAAVAAGFDLADDLADTGTDLAVLVCDVGLVGRALAGYLMGLNPVETNGLPTAGSATAGSGTTVVDDERWMRDVETVRDLQWALRGLRGRPVAMLRALGDPTLATGTAFLLGCARRHTPVLLDGPGAAAAALLAMRCSRPATQWWLPAEVGDVPLHERTHTSLGLTAVTRLGLRVEDGTAGAAGLALLGLAAGLLARG